MFKLSLGIVLYGTKYLTESLPSLLKQNFSEVELLFLDQEEGIFSASKLIAEKLPAVKNDPRVQIFQGPNHWHSGGQNFLIRKSQAAIYIVASNDMFYPPDFLAKIWEFTQKPEHQKFGIFAPKIWRWDFAQGIKTKILDSTGLMVNPAQKFVDRGQGELDSGQYDQQTNVFGVNGACAILRKSALAKIRFQEEFFDELLHYKNDCDLAYRLRWAGEKAIFVPAITCWHDRQFPENSWRGRFQIAREMRLNSFFGHRALLAKNFSPEFSFRIKLAKNFYEFTKILWAIFCEPFLFKAFWQLKQNQGELKEKKFALAKKISPATMEKFFAPTIKQTLIPISNPQHPTPNLQPPTSNLQIKASIIILDYEKSERVCQNVESLQKQQTNFPFEIIIALNATTPKKEAKLKPLARFPNVKFVFQQENLGYPKGNNRAASQAQGEFLFIVNPDIVWCEPKTLQQLVDFLEQNPEVGVVGPRQLEEPTGATALTIRAWPKLWCQIVRRTSLKDLAFFREKVAYDEMRHLDLTQTQKVPWLQSSLWGVRRSVWEELGGLSEDYFIFMSDPDFCWRLWEAGYTVMYYPEARVRADGKRCSAGGLRDFFTKWLVRQHLIDALRFQWKFLGKRKPF